jgi:hypothetical protein
MATSSAMGCITQDPTSAPRSRLRDRAWARRSTRACRPCRPQLDAADLLADAERNLFGRDAGMPVRVTLFSCEMALAAKQPSARGKPFFLGPPARRKMPYTRPISEFVGRGTGAVLGRRSVLRDQLIERLLKPRRHIVSRARQPRGSRRRPMHGEPRVGENETRPHSAPS